MEALRKWLQWLTNIYDIRVRKSPLTLALFIAFDTVLLMLLFEWVKSHLVPGDATWEAYAITIAFVTCLVTAIAYPLLRLDQTSSESVTREKSKRQQAERNLITDRSLLRVLMENIPDPIYFKDAQTRFMRVNRAAARAYGLTDPQQAIGKTDFDFFPPEHAQAAFYDEQQVLRTGQAIIDKEESIPQPDHACVWLSTTKLPLHDERGAVIGTFAISRDITEKKKVETQLQKSEERYRAIIEQSTDGITLIDENGCIVEWNKAMEDLTALRKSEVLQQPLWNVNYGLLREDTKNPALHTLMKESMQKMLNSTRVKSHTFETEICRADGIVRHASITYFNVDVGGDRLYGCTVRDVTARKQTEEKLLFLSTHDVLTGLYNRAHFNDVLALSSQADPYPISVVMIDIDGMKYTNDTLGHAAGDELLRRTAQLLAQTFRGDDVIARVGGDEFAVLLHRTSEEVSPIALERLRLKLREHNGGHPGVLLSLSMGVATASKYSDLAQAMAVADQRMYQDKEAHRKVAPAA